MRRILTALSTLLFFAVLSACDTNKQTDSPLKVTAEPNADAFKIRALAADNDADNWLLHGRTYQGQRYSTLTQINNRTVNQLGLDWYLDLPRDGGQEATPLVVDGIMYFSTTWGQVYAVNATNGEKIWFFDPKVPKETLGKACCGPVNRGVAYWDGKIYVGALDGRLIALDAWTGKLIWSVQTFNPKDSYTITGAPRVANGKVFIGNGGAEFGVRGFVTAYDADSGERVWRFYTVPGDPAKPFENKVLEMAAKTWHGEWWKVGGGGTVWDSISYDPDLNLLYLGVGNSAPWNPAVRSQGKGDNLFVSSIVALNADTGDYVWHYQTTPGDGWDYTATQNMVLADIEIKGKIRKVIMQAPKNGFFYVLDRASGELISAEPYVKVTWASHVDMSTGRPVVNEKSKYWLSGGSATLFPGSYGGHNWKPMAYNPEKRLVYIPATESLSSYKADENFKWAPVGRNNGIDYNVRSFPSNPEAIEKVKKLFSGRLLAWDPINQKVVWSVEQAYPANGGVLATVGNLVFQGTADGFFRAYNADSGEKLWEFYTQTAVMAAPISYRVEGDEYVAVMVGRGGIYGRISGKLGPREINRSRLLVFKLSGNNKLPEVDEPIHTLPDLSAHQVDRDAANTGAGIYARYCASCHGFSAAASGMVPDLRYSGFIQSREAFKQVVLAGILAQRGMVSFAPSISEEDTENVRQYVILQNQLSRKYGDVTRVGR